MIKEIFKKDIGRTIEGVIKADDISNLKEEVQEYVFTNEIVKEIGNLFLDEYVKRSQEVVANGVWISGFFGSGKSHLIKMLSLYLENKTLDDINVPSEFLSNLDEGMFKETFAKAAKIKSESVLFNIFQKHNGLSYETDNDPVLTIFLKVFNNHVGYYGEEPFIANMERQLDEDGQLEDFNKAFESISGKTWISRRHKHNLDRPKIIKALAEVLGTSIEDATETFDGFKRYSLSPEQFAEYVKTYIETKEADFRLNFFVDEFGKFCEDDVQRMMNFQTIAESLATICKGRAWVFATSQQAISTIIEELQGDDGADYTRIQARFSNRINLSGSSVDEVIHKRLLEKKKDKHGELTAIYNREKNNFRTLFNFSEGGRDYTNYKDEKHYIDLYPFAPFHVELFSKSMLGLSRQNAFQGQYQSVGERSMISVFQNVLKSIGQKDLGTLPSFDYIFDGLQPALNGQIQSSILAAERTLSDDPMKIKLLKTLFMVKYVKEFEPTLTHITSLMVEDELLMCLPEDDRIISEIKYYHQANQYFRGLNPNTLSEDMRAIVDTEQRKNNQRRGQIKTSLEKAVSQAEFIMDGKTLEVNGSQAATRMVTAFQQLIDKTFYQLSLLPVQKTEADVKTFIRNPLAADLQGEVLTDAAQAVLDYATLRKGDRKKTYLKDIIDQFKKKSYGWTELSILYVIGELIKKSKADLYENDALVGLSEIENKITSNRHYTTLYLEAGSTIDGNQIRKFKEVYKEFCLANAESNDPRVLIGKFKEHINVETDNILELKRKSSKYPFLDQLDDGLALLRDLEKKNRSYFFDKIDDYEDPLLDFREQVYDPIKQFMNGSSLKIYEDLSQFINNNSANIRHVDMDDREKLESLYRSPTIYKGNGLKDAKSLLDKCTGELKQKIATQRKQSLVVVKAKKTAMQSYPLFQEAPLKVQEEQLEKFDEIIAQIQGSSNIDTITAMVTDAEDNLPFKVQRALLKAKGSDVPTQEYEKIRSVAVSIGSEVLKDTKYTVDYFQREYKWEERHIEQLVSDLASSFLNEYVIGDPREKVEEYNCYYLGPFVVSIKDGQRSIIDGQQRLTSLTLILIYLNNLQKERNLNEELESIIFSEKYGKKSFNIQVDERIHCLEGLFNEGFYNMTNSDDESVINMTNRYLNIVNSFPDEIKGDALPYFIDWLKFNVVLVEIIAYSDENAYTIFETMNDRGLNLTPTEMLKSYILSRFKNDKQRQSANALWKSNIQELHEFDKDEDQRFVQAWLRSKYAQTIRRFSILL